MLFGAVLDAKIMSLRSQPYGAAGFDLFTELRLSRNTRLVVRILQELS
jgi:hypothetical protein